MEKTAILALLENRREYEKRLASLIYGTAEIRVSDGNKYIYVHYRENGLPLTKYVGEFSDELYNLILRNNELAKQIKKQIKLIDKELRGMPSPGSPDDEKVKLNIDFARRHLIDTVYKQAVLEGVAATYADTETIIEGGRVSGLTAEDVTKIVNLKRAWEFILNEYVISSPTDFALLCEINKIVEEGFYYNAGKVRSVPVSIGGTNWTPPLPIESVVREELSEILSSDKGIVDNAIEALLFTMKRQIFIDGNKRAAVIFANHLLISHGKGLIVIPDTLSAEYKKLLIAYYEGHDNGAIKKFLLEKCYKSI